MSRKKFAAGISVVLAALLMPSIRAQEMGYAQPSWGPTGSPTRFAGQSPDYASGMPQQASYLRAENGAGGGFTAPMPIDPNQVAPGVPVAEPGYVRLGGAMYPTPRPNIPIWTGSAVITNQALAPHEMLYPHTYRALYPPYYHRVKGHWLLTPLGVRSHERWELQGTMVQVKYRSNYPGLLSGSYWHPPATSYMHGAWK